MSDLEDLVQRLYEAILLAIGKLLIALNELVHKYPVRPQSRTQLDLYDFVDEGIPSSNLIEVVDLYQQRLRRARVATADLRQSIDLNDVSKRLHSIYYQEIYRGSDACLNILELNRKVTIFPSGKLISVSTRRLSQIEEDLTPSHDIVFRNQLIKPTKIKEEPPQSRQRKNRITCILVSRDNLNNASTAACLSSSSLGFSFLASWKLI